MKKTAFNLLACVSCLAFLIACGGTEKKKAGFFERGKEYFHQQDYTRARLEFKNTVQIDPKYANGYYYLGLVELKSKDFKKALSYLNKAVELDAAMWKAQIEIGRLFAGARMPEKALEKAELVLHLQPDSHEAALLKAVALMMQDKIEQSKEILADLLDQGKTDVDIYVLLAREAAHKGDLDRERAILNQGVQANPNSVALLNFTAAVNARAGRNDESEAVLKKCIELEPAQTAHSFRLAELWWQTGKKDQAVRMITDLIGQAGKAEQVRIDSARFYQSQGDLTHAEQVLKDGLEQMPDSFKLHFALSDVYMRKFMPLKAAGVLRQSLTIEADSDQPEVLQAKNMLARALMTQGGLTEAEELAEAVLSESSGNIEARYIKGRLLMLRKNAAEAISEFRTVVNERPEFVEGHLRLAEAHLNKEEPNLALDTLRSAAKLLPGSKEVQRALARVYVAQKDTANAQSALQRLQAIDPDDASVYASLGDLFAAGEQPDKAEAEYQRLCRLAPLNPLGHLKLSRFYWEKGKKGQALSVLEQALNDNADSVELLSGLVHAYMAENRFEDAAAVCGKSAELMREPAPAYNLLGAVYANQKKYDKAVGALNRAISEQPAWAVPYQNLAQVYLAQGKHEEATERFKAAVKAAPRNPEGYLMLASLYEQQKKFDQAMHMYENALIAVPGVWAAANNLAFLLAEYGTKSGDLDRALQLAINAVDMRPGDPLVQDTLAWVYFKRGNLPLARQMLEEAFEKTSDNPILTYHLGAVLAASGNTAAAREKIKIALASVENFSDRTSAEALLAQLKP